ncbi:MAG: hypothetical protein M1820_000332 [Bogoriella megaspora]|nr:MAG: hypothetical protein M1820_000332 [Bogoriella megaspora]
MDQTTETDSVALQHPSPGLQSLQGAYIGNVERLEQEAERLSSGGSDLAENIRRLKAEQRLSESRRASLRSTPTPAEEGKPSLFTRSRNASTSSYSNSIVDVNSAARWGGYSPGGYVGSPVGSIRSGSYSHRTPPMVRSTSRTSRLTQLPEPEQEGKPLDSPFIGSTVVPTLATPQPPGRRSFSREYENMAQEIREQLDSISPQHDEQEVGMDAEGDATVTNTDCGQGIRDQLNVESPSHDRRAAEIDEEEDLTLRNVVMAQEIHERLDLISPEDIQDNPEHEGTEPVTQPEASGQEHRSLDDHTESLQPLHASSNLTVPQYQEQSTGDHLLIDEQTTDAQSRALTPPGRPSSAASADTYKQARLLFHDFDGVHYAPSIRPGDEDEENDDVPSMRHQPLTRADILGKPNSHIEPPPDDDMVYYPAPVPRTLNLPKRLSQLPAATVQAKRRSQVLGALSPEARNSALWLGQPGTDSVASNPIEGSPQSAKSQSKTSLTGLPPQLRASAYFDPPAVSQDVEIKGESAVATLDSILEASATAPVGVFTDHPFAGKAGRGIFGRERMKRSTTSPLEKPSDDNRKSRSTLSLLLGRRKSAGPDQVMQNGNSSKLSLGTQLNGAGEDQEGPNQDAEEEEDQAEEEEDDDFEQFGPPSTLLAELQLRKRQQKQRNRTAATAFPNGMHSTLLELDAVAQVEKKRRMAQRPALAWEDSQQRAAEEGLADDDDVPLGMLFPGRDGLVNKSKGQSDWDRPLGLIERRELEDNEPLSRRRNRLRGISPNKREPSPDKRATANFASQEHLLAQKPEPEDSEEDEPLAQRVRRLKNRETLNAAIGDVGNRPLSSDFASELMSQFGGVEENKDAAGRGKAAMPEDPEEETLGQRRKRLQAEALAARNGTAQQNRNTSGGSDPQGQASGARPSLKPTRSLADLLSANPTGSRQSSAEQGKAATRPGTLLFKNEDKQERRRTRMLEQNRKSAAEGLNAPLLNVPAPSNQLNSVGQPSGGFAGGLYNDGMGGVGQSTPITQSTPGLGYGGMMSPLGGVAPTMPMAGMAGMAGSAMSGMPGVPGMTNPMIAGMPGMASAPMTTGMMGMPMGMQPATNGYFNNMAMYQQQMPFGNFQQPIGGMGVGMNPGIMMPGFPAQQNRTQGHQMTAGPGLDLAMDPRQRDLIDRWRQSIA